MKNIIKLAAFLMVLAVLIGSVPVGAMAKNEKGNNGNGNGNGKNKSSIERVVAAQDNDDDDEDEDEDDDDDKDKSKNKEKGDNEQVTGNKQQVSGEKLNGWARFWSFFRFGAGRSGKIPPGLLRAPGIQKKIGHMSTTTVSVFPGISNISVSNVASTSVKISWRTNKPTTSSLYFGTSTPVGTTTSGTVLSSQSNTVHSSTLVNLSPSTIYFYKIVARDNAGKVSSSTDLSFTTASGVIADTSAPVISNVVATTTMLNATTTGPVRVTWSTNELATSKVWFGTSTPVVSGTSTQTVSSAFLVSNHDMTLPTLAASTTYYMMVSSADAAGNTSSSAEFNFTVAP